MQESQVAVPPAMTPDEWGLGWMLFDWDGRRLIGHDGSTLGQNSYLRIVPDDGVAVVVMANGGNAAALYRRIVGAVLDPLTSIAVPPLPDAQLGRRDPITGPAWVDEARRGDEVRAGSVRSGDDVYRVQRRAADMAVSPV